jgi:hypothetical protein
MKYIQFKTEDKKLWTVYLNHITSIYEVDGEIGCFVRLSCGKELHTQLSRSLLFKNVIEQALND